MGIPHVAAGFGTLGNDGRGAELLHLEGIGDGSDHGDDPDAGFQPLLHIRSRGSGTGRYDLHPFFHHHLRAGRRIGGRQHEVHAEGLSSQGPGLPDLGADRLSPPVDGGNQAQAARLGNSCCEARIGNPGHAALEDGLPDSEKVADNAFNHNRLQIYGFFCVFLYV